MPEPTAPHRTIPGRRLFHSSDGKLWLLATVIIAINAISQGLVSTTADVDQAGELVHSQWLAWGYGSQPPLYTWLVHGIFRITGPSLWALRALKVALLSTIVASTLMIGRRLRFSASQQTLTIVGLALIPQLAWEAQRDLTHSVLAAAMSLLTINQLMATEARKSTLNYGLAGAVAAVGVLSKYTYVLFLASILATGLIVPAYRRTLMKPRAVVALVVFSLMIAGHGLWALAHPQQALEGLDKLDSGTGAMILNRLKGISSALINGLAFLTPLWIAAAALGWGRIKATSAPGEQLLRRLPLTTAAVVLVVILATGATRIKDRWYQSLLAYAPLVVASLAGPSQPRQLRCVVTAAGASAAMAASVLLPGRTIFASIIGDHSRPNMPLHKLISQLPIAATKPDLILASSSLLAGNARLMHPNINVSSANAISKRPVQGSKVLIIRADDDKSATAASLDEVISELFQIAPDSIPYQTISQSMLWIPEETQELSWALLSIDHHQGGSTTQILTPQGPAQGEL
jgi:hypothetical protein